MEQDFSLRFFSKHESVDWLHRQYTYPIIPNWVYSSSRGAFLHICVIDPEYLTEAANSPFDQLNHRISLALFVIDRFLKSCSSASLCEILQLSIATVWASIL